MPTAQFLTLGVTGASFGLRPTAQKPVAGNESRW